MTDNEMIVRIQNRVRSLLEEKGGKSEYRLYKDAGIAQSTISSLLHSNTLPTSLTLQTLCNYFGITLSQFFFDETPFRTPSRDRNTVDNPSPFPAPYR